MRTPEIVKTVHTGRFRPMLMLIVVAIVHFGLSQISTFTIAVPFKVSLIWLPAGIGVAAIAALGQRAAIAIFASALANSLQYDSGSAVALGTSLGSAIQCALIGHLLGRFARLAGPDSVHNHLAADQGIDYRRFYLTLAFGTVVAPTLGALTLCAGELVPWQNYWQAWAGWWVGDVSGVLVATPLAYHALQSLQNNTGLTSWKLAVALSAIPLGLLMQALDMAIDYQLILSYPGETSGSVIHLIGHFFAATALILVGIMFLRSDVLRGELAAANLRNETSIQNSHDIIQSLNPDGSFFRLNPAWHHTLGYSPQEAARMNFWDILAPELHDHCRQMMGALQGGADIGSVELTLVAKNGQRILVEGYPSQIKVPGEPTRTVTFFRDITERMANVHALAESRDQIAQQASQVRVLNAELLKQAKLADSANRAKSEFLAAMSHELRTPLNAVIGYSYLLGRSGLNAEQQQYIDQIDSSSKHLLAMISDVLDISQAEAGMLQLGQKDFSLRAMLSQVMDMTAERARSKGLDLTLHVDSSQDLFHGDPVRLRQCLLNYVGNAIKFTERGRIAIDVSTSLQADGATMLRCEVSDTGAGIEPDMQAAVFEPFRQADMSRQRHHGGAGLGLAITRRLSRLMGGDTGVSSQVGIGSRFWFTARLQAPTQDAQSPDAPPSASQSPADRLRKLHSGSRVLVVEDEPINQGFIRQMLTGWGLIADIAQDGEQALDMTRDTSFDCVLMDVHMPGMSGIELTRQLRRLPGWSAVPIIALTADAREDNRQACLQAGMNDFIAKPVDPNRLCASMITALAKPATSAGAPGEQRR